MWVILVCIALVAIIYYKGIRPIQYWNDKGVMHMKAYPIVGSFHKLAFRKLHFIELFDEIYKAFPTERYVGFMSSMRPNLLIRDLDLIKQIGVKEFESFPDHFSNVSVDTEPLLARALTSLRGDKWRKMRATLSPAFTSSKMRSMYRLMDECAQNFVQHFQKKEAVSIEMKDIFTRFTNDVIASTAFGIQTDSLNNPENEFFSMGKSIMNFTPGKIIKAFLLQTFPILGRVLGLKIFPEEMNAFFRNIVKDNMKQREAKGIIRPDMIQLLMEAKRGKLKHEANKEQDDAGFATVEESDLNKNADQIELCDDDIVAQALLFFLAGFDTASTAACFMAYELALNPEVQKKLQDEIDSLNNEHNGKVSYEVLLSMKYLDQVISEVLRMWPPAALTERLCERDFTIEPKNSWERAVIVEKGISVLFPIRPIHRNPDYFPEPDRFDPDRFSDENKSKIVPGSYMPFGIGPRNCIGSRFALLEVKTLFFHLLSKFDIVTVEKTEIPIKFAPSKIQMAPSTGFWLGFRPRKLTSL